MRNREGRVLGNSNQRGHNEEDGVCGRSRVFKLSFPQQGRGGGRNRVGTGMLRELPDAGRRAYEHGAVYGW